MKQQIIDKLTSSKNERLAFGVIWDQTVGNDHKSKVILNDDFYRAGISTRKAINMAVNRLQEKGLIFKIREVAHRYDFDVYRYTPIFSGCSHFLNGEV